MASKILVDTSVLIGLQLGDEQLVADMTAWENEVVICRITACEFIYGARDKQEKRINKHFLDQLEIVEIEPVVSELAYKLLDVYGLKVRLGIADALIAATAIAHDYRLWTLNTKHFQAIKEVQLV